MIILCAFACALLMPETGFVRRPPDAHLRPGSQLVSTVRAGAGFVRVQPLLLLIVAIAFFTGMSSEALDRLWEAHFIRDIGLPRVGSLDPVVWFGGFGAASLVVGFVGATYLIGRFDDASSSRLARGLLVMTGVLVAGDRAPEGAVEDEHGERLQAVERGPLARLGGHEVAPLLTSQATDDDVAQPADRRFERPRHGDLDREPVGRHRPGGRRPGARRDRQRLRHSGSARRRRRDPGARTRTVRPRPPPRRARARARGASAPGGALSARLVGSAKFRRLGPWRACAGGH